MLIRYLIAFIGAAAITLGLLMFMNGFAKRYVNEDAIRYFQIMDFIPGPDRGRERIRPPPDPRLAPEVPELEQDRPLDVPPASEFDPGTTLDPGSTLDPEIIRRPAAPESA